MDQDLLPDLINIAKGVGAIILPYWHHLSSLEISEKKDGSPLSEADLAAHAKLINELTQLTPQIPILSEETNPTPDFKDRRNWSEYWLLDPLDGTRGFIRGSDEFSINIALVRDQKPVLGIIYAPVTDICYYGLLKGGAFKKKAKEAHQPLKSQSLDWARMRIAVGQFQGSKKIKEFVKHLEHSCFIHLNSALKFGLIAEGCADVYLRYGPTCEWDTAAGQIILKEAGGILVDMKGEELKYNAKQSLENPPFLALGDKTQLKKILEIIAEGEFS